ncbi:adenosylmethionine--8-amino-7-oxononanoate transaminase [Marinobacter nanhaiticus D15-8W]|uniref:Adenosylmethionine-8-amino-7-oxononanoate aminotransferase n=1 Tax=Marinobacter nanhaiticus D15-8W TaxID=626887 RepID=N6WXS0_9GAMM|nr:adenosylmethionine--8-amino-7-oxononanoate transaminase [Marinobacter nanhaiticus]ENO16396.1 adenosylmethionine--8-amino-7-oxononanoate transaminase [Marinobacter nanhaiticus D15-8W]BES72743.1 adenosylmethionine--8-amino-7-oxononanoate transaminase [Marinobacter nanhaiticus D15-8W]
MRNADLVKRDLKSVWHPCTQMKDHETLPLIPIKRGEGVWLEDFEENRYIDAVSSWWVNLFGHANPRINAAIREQTEQLEHVILAGFSHEPVVNLSERLIEVTPEGLNKCFYADNGSSAIEAALKMSYHYWRNMGKPGKKNFVNLGNSYHGETLGALALGDVSLYKDTYEPLLMEVITAPSPDAFNREAGESWEDYALRQFEGMEKILAERHDEICAVVVEPLIQCAGNMRMHHAIYHKKLREACDKYGVHLIADEIAVGFGRTGTMFACEQAGISPDFMCLSKGLTAGYLPLSVVLTTDTVYDAFYDDYETMRAFLHSHSYTGNPIGCAVALATLDIFRDDNVIENNRRLAQCMTDSVAHLADHPNVGDIRQHGMTLAIEMVKDRTTKTPFPWQERRGIKVYRHSLTRQALLRPLGNVVYFMPPYVITEEQIKHLAQVATEGIEIAVRD